MYRVYCRKVHRVDAATWTGRARRLPSESHAPAAIDRRPTSPAL